MGELNSSAEQGNEQVLRTELVSMLDANRQHFKKDDWAARAREIFESGDESQLREELEVQEKDASAVVPAGGYDALQGVDSDIRTSQLKQQEAENSRKVADEFVAKLNELLSAISK